MAEWKDNDHVIRSSSGVEEPTNDIDDCYSCMTNLSGYSNKNMVDIYYQSFLCYVTRIAFTLISVPEPFLTCKESSTVSDDEAQDIIY